MRSRLNCAALTDMSREHRSKWLQLIILILRLLLGTCEIQYPSIQWTPRNPIFGSGRRLNVLPMSKVDFVCPNPSTILERMSTNQISKYDLYENIWFVGKNGYNNCKVDENSKTRLVTRCNEPLELKYNTVVFQPHSADDGLIFTPGQEYYFIATSDGSQKSINRTSGGHCASHNMKLKVYVCKDKYDPRCQDEKPSSSPTKASTRSRVTPLKRRKVLKCYTCQDCGTEKGTEEVCHNSDLNICLWKSSVTNGRQVITRKCGNITSCTMEQESCTTNNSCEVLCCNGNLCNLGTTSAAVSHSVSSRLVPCVWMLTLGWLCIVINIVLSRS